MLNPKPNAPEVLTASVAVSSLTDLVGLVHPVDLLDLSDLVGHK